MATAVQFLESLSVDPALRSQEDFVEAVSSTRLEPDIKDALLAGDLSLLNLQLGGPDRMFCAVFLPEHDEPNEDHQHDVDGLTADIRACA